jgi:hypothetical protein
MNIVFDLNFHFVLVFFGSLNFFKCVFATMYLLNFTFLLLRLLLMKFILVCFTFFLTQWLLFGNERSSINCCNG